MWSFLQQHETAAVFVMVACVIAVVMHYERWRDRKAFIESTQHVWQCVQFGGGAMVYTPSAMNKADAVEYASRLGSVAYVDEPHNKIFFRAKS